MMPIAKLVPLLEADTLIPFADDPKSAFAKRDDIKRLIAGITLHPASRQITATSRASMGGYETNS